MIVASLMGLTFVLYAQVTLPPGSVSTIPGDRSPYLGRPIINPETLSGFWETPNGHGGAVGIHLLLMTTVPTDGWEKPSDAPQSWQLLELGVYERRGATIQLEESNNFSDSPRGGNVGFEAGHLSLHWISPPNSEPIDVDLVQQPGDRWAGRLHRRSFDANVILSRPGTNVTAEGTRSPEHGWEVSGCRGLVSTLRSRLPTSSSGGRILYPGRPVLRT
jgi:hypothetical protein